MSDCSAEKRADRRKARGLPTGASLRQAVTAVAWVNPENVMRLFTLRLFRSAPNYPKPPLFRNTRKYPKALAALP